MLNDFKKTFREFVILTVAQTLVVVFFVLVDFLSSKFFGFDLVGVVTGNNIFLAIAVLISFACTGYVAIHIFNLHKDKR